MVVLPALFAPRRTLKRPGNVQVNLSFAPALKPVTDTLLRYTVPRFPVWATVQRMS